MKHLSEENLESLIKNETRKRSLEGMIFIRSLYAGENVENAAKKLGRCRATGYNWLSIWDRNGPEGLKPKFRGGRPSKLSEAQLSDLKRRLHARNSWTPRDARQFIRDEYGVEYSVIMNSWSQLSKRLSFASNWFSKFLPQEFNMLCN